MSIVSSTASETALRWLNEQAHKASIRDDAKAMVDQISDGKVSVWERATNSWMKLTRGDVADRFDKIKDVYIDVQKDTKVQIEKEFLILEALAARPGGSGRCGPVRGRRAGCPRAGW